MVTLADRKTKSNFNNEPEVHTTTLHNHESYKVIKAYYLDISTRSTSRVCKDCYTNGFVINSYEALYFIVQIP